MKSFIRPWVLPLFIAAVQGSACADSQTAQDWCNGNSMMGQYTSKATAYYPAANSMEGGFKDRKGNRLHTLQEYLDGQAPYVSVAMDVNAFPYGTKLHIPEISQVYGRDIVFQVVDTGGAFRGKGRTRIDICVGNYSASHDPEVNQRLTLIRCDE